MGFTGPFSRTYYAFNQTSPSHPVQVNLTVTPMSDFERTQAGTGYKTLYPRYQVRAELAFSPAQHYLIFNHSRNHSLNAEDWNLTGPLAFPFNRIYLDFCMGHMFNQEGGPAAVPSLVCVHENPLAAGGAIIGKAAYDVAKYGFDNCTNCSPLLPELPDPTFQRTVSGWVIEAEMYGPAYNPSAPYSRASYEFRVMAFPSCP